MYLEPRETRARTSPFRVVILCLLILAGLYVIYDLRRNWTWTNPFAPIPTPTRSAYSYFDEAEQDWANGKVDEAIAAYTQAVTLDPELEEALVTLTRLLVLEGRAAEALSSYGPLLQQLDTSDAHAALGMALDWHAAAPSPTYQETYNTLGIPIDPTSPLEEMRKQLLKAALESCNRAHDLAPENAQAYACLAEVYADLQSWNEALAQAEKALAIDPTDYNVHRTYAYVLESMARYDEAIQAYREAIALQPNLSHLYIALGRNYLALGSYTDAINQFQTAIEVDPDNPAGYDMLGWTYGHYLGEFERAIIELERAIDVDPTYANAYGHLGMLAYARRRYEDAIPAFIKAIELGATSIEYYYELGLSYIYLNEDGHGCDLGVPWLRRALERDPTCQPCLAGLEICP